MSKSRGVVDELRERACREWDADDIETALRIAEQAPSSSDNPPQCPSCGSSAITVKACRFADHDQREPGKWRCRSCGEHFDEPTSDREGS